MTERAPTTSRRRGLFWLGLVAVVLVIVLAGGAPRTYEHLGADSVGPTGARGLVLLLEGFGADVTVSDSFDGDTDVVLVLRDDLTDAQRAELDEWVAAGGRAVIADPFSPTTPFVAGSVNEIAAFPVTDIDAATCDIAELAGRAGVIDPAGGFRYEVAGDARGCFGDDGEAFVVVTPVGDGEEIALGSELIWVNERLDTLDNAVLAVDLIVNRPDVRVTFLQRDTRAEAEVDSLWTLVSPSARAAIWQVALAAVVYLAFRMRRLGRPVIEAQPVQIAGSELVVAVGNLLQQSGDPARAADLLRRDLRSALSARLGLPRELPTEALVQMVVDRTGLDSDRVAAALSDTPPVGDEGLVALAVEIEAIRVEVLHGQPAAVSH